MDEHLKTILAEYAIKRIDETISQDEFEKLNAFLKSDKEAARYYNELLMVDLNFQEFGEKITSPESSDQCSLDDDLLIKLAQAEQIAPEVVIEAPDDDIAIPFDDNKVVKPGKFMRIYNILVSAAAVLLFMFILYAQVFPPKYTVPVADVVDQCGVKWSSESASLDNGDILLTNQPPYALEEGFIKLSYDQGVEVLIEAPAEFQILAKDRIGLNYGKVYSVVSKAGTGFSVYTDNAKVIDLGTEFGVFADANGDTSIHVVKGKTMLIAGSDSDTVSLEIKNGIAKRVSASNQAVTDVSFNEELFARDIDSDKNYIWRGQNSVSLADIIGGGNGFGSGHLEYGIEVDTGKLVTRLNSTDLIQGPKGFMPVKDLGFVDGIFVPGANKDNTFIVSNQELSYPFPETGGFYWGYVINGAFHSGVMVPKHSLILNNTVYGNKDNPAICMHPNLGVTFDLQAIRKEYPDVELVNFRSIIGISQSVKKYVNLNGNASYGDKDYDSAVEFWVIVDGENVIQKEVTNAEPGVQINVPLNAESRYLTLAATEMNGTISYGWALFANPELSIEFSDK